MNKSFIVIASIAAIGLGACGTAGSGDGMAKKPVKVLDAAALAKEFKKGSKVCKWTMPNGSKGEDFYFKTTGAYSGDADRNIGSKTTQGTWKIVGQGFWTKFAKGKKARGKWHNVVKVKKNTYQLLSSDGKHVMDLKCS